MAKRPTVYDVAQAAGVSIATVSFAFRQPERVRAGTREAVLRAARELDYMPSASARGLARGRTGALGLFSYVLLLEEPADEPVGEEDFRTYPLYVDEVQRGFELECARRGQALLIGSDPRGEGEGVMDIVGRVDGLAVFPGARPAELLVPLARLLPVVAFATAADDGVLHHVRVDNRAGTRALVTHLARTHGIGDIGFVGETRMSEVAERFDGLRLAMADLGLRPPDGVLDPTPVGSAEPFPEVKRLHAGGALPRALVCASDQLALELMDVLDALGVAVPGDVAVTGFDGVVAGRLHRPTLTTVRQPMEAMGRLAVEILVAALEDPAAAPQRHRLPVRPLFRESCGCGRS
ncbi:MAG: LacI family transcriptional regulator [Cellulomonas sp.]|nr:LacI family transcriptional regulator [Cellulomonas sp.]